MQFPKILDASCRKNHQMILKVHMWDYLMKESLSFSERFEGMSLENKIKTTSRFVFLERWNFKWLNSKDGKSNRFSSKEKPTRNPLSPSKMRQSRILRFSPTTKTSCSLRLPPLRKNFVQKILVIFAHINLRRISASKIVLNKEK